MPKSIGWRLTLSFAAIALVAAVVLGAILLAILQNYYTQRELDYLDGNARTISTALSKIMSSDLPSEQIQAQVASLAFLSQARIQVLDEKGAVLYDSGVPSSVNLSLGVAQVNQRVELDPNGRKFFQIITVDKKTTTDLLPFEMPIDLPGGETQQDVFLFKTLSATGSPFGFNLSAEADSDGARSPQRATELFTTQNNLRYRLTLSDGPSYGRDILTSVAVGWAIASAIAVLFAVGVGWFISRRISAPVLALTHVTTRMAQGELGMRADARGQDEFGQLAHSFNDMADRVETTIVMLRRFVSDAAHELGTPMTALKSNLDLAADEGDAAQRALFLARAQETVTRLENTSRDLLDLSRLESHASQAAATNVNLLALVQANAEVYASRAEQAGVRFEMRLPNDPVFVQADAGQVERAIHNVIDNALKFTPSGGTVQVELEQATEWTRLCVSDTGIGIPHEDLPSLFQRFHRARNAAAYPGSGLGLAIVQAILREQHGNVRVEPLGVGTRFILEWRTV